MKAPFLKFPLLLLLIIVSFSNMASAYDGNDPELIDDSYNLYSAGNIYLAGQPSREQLKSLVDKGVSMIINIRTDEEMDELAKTDFDEKSFVENELNIPYVHVPMGGSVGYSDLMTKEIAAAISTSKGKVLIHCRSAGRATLVWMAWSVNYNHTDINDAFRMGKMARFTFPIEDLIGSEIKMKNPKRIK